MMKKLMEMLKGMDWKKAVRSKRVWLAAFALVVAVLEASGVHVGEGIQEGFEKILQFLIMIGFISM